MGMVFAGDRACDVRGLYAPVGRCRLSQLSNNNSTCRYTGILAGAASLREYSTLYLSITSQAPRISNSHTPNHRMNEFIHSVLHLMFPLQ